MKEFYLEDFSPESKWSERITALCQGEWVDISIAYPSDFRSAKLLREIVDSICKSYNIDPKWRTRFVLIIDEMNNNAIEYWSQKGDVNYLNIAIIPTQEGKFKVSVSVVDTGKWDHAKKSSDMEKIRGKYENKDFAQHHSIRWRGLFLIISHLVDTLYFKDSQKGWLIVGIEKVL